MGKSNGSLIPSETSGVGASGVGVSGVGASGGGGLTLPDLSRCPKIDSMGVTEATARFCKRAVKKDAKVRALKLALSMIDLTTLEGADTPGKVRQLCVKAMHPCDTLEDVSQVAAVCVYPAMVSIAKAALEGSGIRVASVATAFPSGQYPLALKLADVKQAVEAGADEIDMVISRGKFLAGEYQYVFDEIAATKKVCDKAHLKVILETGELGSLENVRKASELAIHAGADFIKTSTGKIQPAATMPVTLVMLQAIADHYDATGKVVGMKPAGGISTAKVAIQYLVMLSQTLGQDWLTPQRFRFGASRLATDILMQLGKMKTGVYQGPDYYSKD